MKEENGINKKGKKRRDYEINWKDAILPHISSSCHSQIFLFVCLTFSLFLLLSMHRLFLFPLVLFILFIKSMLWCMPMISKCSFHSFVDVFFFLSFFRLHFFDSFSSEFFNLLECVLHLFWIESDVVTNILFLIYFLFISHKCIPYTHMLCFT